MVDMHVPSLLIFPPRTHFYNHPAYKNGTVILQDKASCLPVHLLAPPPGSTILDMCAAPGMKTTQLAAALANDGVVYAVERDSKRVETLKHIVGGTEATCVKVINKDVLQCSNKDFSGVEYILVDPSCSGSGMTERITETENKNPARLEKLAGFQILILRSALTRYPDVKRVAYSTCSVHPEENEEVVRQVLETNYNFKLVDAKKLLKSAWKSFGGSDYGKLGEFCLYARPDKDLTNGFFVAVFERLEEGEQNQFFNKRISNFTKHLNAVDKRKERKLEGQENMENHKAKKGKKNKGEESVPEEDLNNFDGIENTKNNKKYTVEDEKLNEKSRQKYVKERRLDDDVDFAETVSEKSTKKKKKKRVTENDVECQETVINSAELESIVDTVSKKNKKEKKKENDISKNDVTNDSIPVKDKSRKNKCKNGNKIREATEDTPKNDVTLETNNNTTEEDKPRKKKRKHSSGSKEHDSVDVTLEMNNDTIEEDKPKKKKRKHSNEPKEHESVDETLGNNDITVKVKSRKKKDKYCSEVTELIEGLKNDEPSETNDNITKENKLKRKKRKHCSGSSELIEDPNKDETTETNDNIVEHNQSKKKKRKNCSEVNDSLEVLENPDATFTSETNDNIVEHNQLKKKKRKN